MKPSSFDAATAPLATGVNLIEASAGTGKTFTLVMLALRFIVETGLPIERLLVVTFTKAATAELKERIRSRLAEARLALRQTGTQADSTLARWLMRLPVEPALASRRLALALLDIDKARIFTLHGFCQRILHEQALECGQPLGLELTEQLTTLRQACADDFWRQQIYPRSTWEVAALTADYATPEALLASVDGLPEGIAVYPTPSGLNAVLSELAATAQRAAAHLPSVKKILDTRQQKTFKPAFYKVLDTQLGQLERWLHGEALPPPTDALHALTYKGLYDGLNGNRWRAQGKQSADVRKRAYLQAMALDADVFDALAAVRVRLSLELRVCLLATLNTGIKARLQQHNAISFDGLISRVAEVLQGAGGDFLAQTIRQHYGVVFIDEFQDTDSVQWEIFSTLFANPDHRLYLIGDPKQAIYKFRGADIYTYLKAKNQTGQHFTLAQNFRSHPGLVNAVNILFQRENAFHLPALAFTPVLPAKSAHDGYLYRAGQPAPPMMLWQLAKSDSTDGYWRPGSHAAEDLIKQAVANEIVTLLSDAYALQPGGTALQAKHIAVLVRTNQQAEAYQTALRAVGVASVLNHTQSVLQSPEAGQLYTVLQAVAQPGNLDALKQTLALDWFGLDGQAFFQRINDAETWDAQAARFVEYHQTWQKCGLMAMMQEMLENEHINTTLAKMALAERRLTNIRHLLELLQQAAITEHLDLKQTLTWFALAINETSKQPGSSEQQQLRLESDADAVQIVTLHRSKGLEYPVVFCPNLWRRNLRLGQGKTAAVCHENGRMVADLGSEAFGRRHQQALAEELAEDIRLAYVALTRAQYRCYLVWADARSQEHSNSAALAWLLGDEFAAGGFAVQQAHWQNLWRQYPDCFGYHLVSTEATALAKHAAPSPPLALTVRRLSRSLQDHWQISSYTALSTLSMADDPQLPTDKSGERDLAGDGLAHEDHTPSWLPRGKASGNLVHELLEKLPFSELANNAIPAENYLQYGRRYGLTHIDPQAMGDLLQTVVTTSLSDSDPSFCLKNLPASACAKELPFYLSLPALATSQINAVLSGIPTVQALVNKSLQGFLTGFIDLVCCHQGYYYAVDYKTHCLPDYAQSSLTEAMHQHNYGLQYWLYAVVLHRYLQNRLPGYHYQRHFGGIRYLFVRGMRRDTAASGVFCDRPDQPRLEALAQIFSASPGKQTPADLSTAAGYASRHHP